jgi:hypothetical protein
MGVVYTVPLIMEKFKAVSKWKVTLAMDNCKITGPV